MPGRSGERHSVLDQTKSVITVAVTTLLLARMTDGIAFSRGHQMALKFRTHPRNGSPGFLIYQAATRMKTGLHRAFLAHGFDVTPE